VVNHARRGKNAVNEELYIEIERLQGLHAAELQERYREVFGQKCRTKHKQHLIRRIAWRLQALAYGDLSERARQRTLVIANDADLRTQVPAAWIRGERVSTRVGPKDKRLPVTGTILSRKHGSKTVTVKVLKDGFEYEGQRYRSLSAIARVATGTRWNGLLFFGLAKRRRGREHGGQ
jgi:DUF2924 family protein